MDRQYSVRLFHSCCNPFKKLSVFLCQHAAVQYKLTVSICVSQQLAHIFIHSLIIPALYIGKAQKNHRISPLHLSVLLIFPDRKPFKQIPPACMLH